MTAVTGARGGLKAHQDSIRLPEPERVRDLRDLLGAQLVAYIGSVKETRAVRQCAVPTASFPGSYLVGDGIRA